MKLVRDNDPIISTQQRRTRMAGPVERWVMLKARLAEEAAELSRVTAGSEQEFDCLVEVVEMVTRLCEDIEVSEPGRLASTFDDRLRRFGEIGYTIALDEGEE